ncbi:MAG TPA: cytochrome c biogenesis protein ResB [Candidatus Limnocylindria bacterium]
MAASSAAVNAVPVAERAARTAERILRAAGDGRTGIALLGLTGIANAAAALLPDGRELLQGPAYAVLLGLVALSGVAAVAVRAPAVWREWRRPGAVQPGAGALTAVLPAADVDRAGSMLAAAGYRTRVEVVRGRWAVHGVRRGWSRFAGMLSHLALVGLVLGAAIGAAFGSETVFSLVNADQALLDAPRPGFSSAMRLDRFEAAFGPDGRPSRLDTSVTFLRDGEPVREAVLKVNEPGTFDGYLVHPWTYGPAARLRVTTLGGSPLLDAPVPLESERDGVAVGSAELPTLGLTLGMAIAGDGELGVSVIDGGGLVDSAVLRPGDEIRIGDVEVAFDGFDAWVTFMSRRDPGLPLLLVSGIALCAALAIAFWLPRRRVSLRPHPGGLALVLRGERFDRPTDELERLGVLASNGP